MCARRRRHSVTLAAVLLAALGPARAGEVATRCEPVVWRTDVGGPRKGVLSFAQSPDGFLWMLNTETLSRFDGTTFHSLTLTELPDGTAPAALWSDATGFRLADTGGTVWQWQDGGFTKLMDGEKDGARVAAAWGLPDGSTTVVNTAGQRWLCRPGTPARALPGTIPMKPGRVCWTDNGEGWWVHPDGGSMVHSSGDSLSTVALPPDAGDIVAIAATSRDLWVATDHALLRWTGTALAPEPPPVGQDTWRIKWMDASPLDCLWFEAGGTLHVHQNGKWNSFAVPWPDAAPRVRTHVDAAGTLWSAERGGDLTALRPDGEPVILDGITELNGTGIESLFSDREGNTWAGIARVGLVQFRRQRFRSLTTAGGLPAPMIWTLCEGGDGSIWFSGEAPFLGRYKGGRLTVQDVDSGTIPGQAGALWRDREGRMLTGFSNKGLFREALDRFVPEPPFFQPALRGAFHFIYDDRSGRRWLGLNFGVVLFDGRSTRLFNHSNGLRDTAMRAVTEDAAGRLWIGSASGGAAWFDNEKFHPVTRAEGLPHNSVYALRGAADGSVWIGTVGGGLARWREGNISVCTTAHGLPDNRIMQLLEDGAGFLWVGTRAGLSRITLTSLDAFERGEVKSLDLVTFDRCDGLPTREFSGGKEPTIIKARDGALWFATTGGLASCYPATLTLNRVPPQAQILTALLDGQPAGHRPPAQSPYGALEFGLQSLEVPPGPHSLEFRWTAPCLISGEKTRYSYRLEGVEHEWSPASEQTAATYGTLPHGSYRLLVRACNHDGTWSAAPAALSVTVQPWWWQRTAVRVTALLLGALLLTLTILAAVRARHRRHLARAELRRVRETERSRIARDLHDDLGSSLTEISMLATTLPGPGSEPGTMRGKLQTISGKARSLVEALDEIVWAVNPRHDTADSLATYLTGYARSFLTNAHIDCSFDVPSPLPDIRLDAGPRHSLFLALKEILHNIVRHSGATVVKLTLRTGDAALAITVEDNGRGLPPGENGDSDGDGLRNLRERLHSAGGECTVQSTPGAGTCVRLRLPFAAATPVP